MKGFARAGLVMGWAAVLGLTVGCSPESAKPVESKQPPSSKAPSEKTPPGPAVAKLDASKPAEKVAEKVERTKPQAAEGMPKVALSQELLQTCRVKVGDAMPDAELPTLDGQKQSLRSLLGKSLTVVFFFNSDDPRSRTGLEDLQADVAQPMAAKGVAVVGVHRGDKNDAAKAMAQNAKAAFPILADGDGVYFAKVATEKLPRTYLLGPDGKILWFDLEYSRTTQRELLQAIRFVLK